jgi:hypothetical protein
MTGSALPSIERFGETEESSFSSMSGVAGDIASCERRSDVGEGKDSTSIQPGQDRWPRKKYAAVKS